MIPQTFEEWKYCVENKCKIQLSKSFVEGRLRVYLDKSNPETIAFIRLYGLQHFKNIINWLGNS